MNITVKYSKRSTKGIKVDSKTAGVVVSVPIGTSREEIGAFIKDYQGWIDKTVAKVKKNISNSVFINIADGGQILYLGQHIWLKFVPKLNQPTLNDGILFVPAESPENCIVKFYKNAIRELVEEYVEKYQGAMGVKPERITITGARTRWGSCCSKNRISFSFRLVMAPPEVIEYVVVHELSHMLHMNHSPAFYQTVKKFYGDYKPAEKWLKANSPLLGKF